MAKSTKDDKPGSPEKSGVKDVEMDKLYGQLEGYQTDLRDVQREKSRHKSPLRASSR
jgi:hypothetical protein